MIEIKYIALSEEIESGIKRGLWVNRMPGVIKLGRDMHVNPATVSKAFRLLVQKGLLAVDGTRGAYIVKQNIRPSHRVLGIVGIGPDDLCYAEEWTAMEAKAKEKGYRVIGLAHSRKLFAQKENMKLLLQFPVDGYIFMYSSITAKIAEFLFRNNMSFVACSKAVGIPGIDYVDFDPEVNFEKGMQHLIELGHKRIAYVEFNNINYSYSVRIFNLYKKILSRASLLFDKSFFISEKSSRYYNIYKEKYPYEYGRICAEKLTQRRGNISAALISSSNIADGFIEGLKVHNLKCPDDVSIIVYGGKRKEDFFTNIRMEYIQRAREVTEALIDLIENPGGTKRHTVIECELFIKKSTAPLIHGASCVHEKK